MVSDNKIPAGRLHNLRGIIRGRYTSINSNAESAFDDNGNSGANPACEYSCRFDNKCLPGYYTDTGSNTDICTQNACGDFDDYSYDAVDD